MAPLPSLSSLTMNATPTGRLGRATAADVAELVAVLTAQRAQPQGARAFEGNNDSLDRLLRSAVVWQGGEAPPGDRAAQAKLLYAGVAQRMASTISPMRGA